MKTRIFIGFDNSAGIAVNLQNGFRLIGVSSDFYSNEKTKQITDYNENDSYKLVPVSNNKLIRYFKTLIFFSKILIQYDVFIFTPAGNSLFSHHKDIIVLNFLRKTTINIFIGCDARLPKFVNSFKWNPCSNCTSEYKSFVGCKLETKEEKLEKISRTYKYLFSPKECSGIVEKKYFNFLFPIDLSKFILIKKRKVDNTIRILHAPSDKGVKGTKYILKVMDALKLKYPNIEFVLLNNVPHIKVLNTIKEVDLIIDQLLVGFYGVFAVEAMASQKPVIAYIRPDIWEEIKDECPIYNANPDTLSDILEQILLNPEQLEERGEKSRIYIEKFHDASIVANNILSVLNL